MRDYHSYVRRDIKALLPTDARRILELGCGRGHTLGWLKERYWTHAETWGVDYDTAGDPNPGLDTFRQADLNRELPVKGRFDLILALDVLEHLIDPDALLQRLVRDHLSPGGTVIVSLPNFSHYSVSVPLLFNRSYEMKGAGIKDRTHLRIFTEANAVRLMNQAGLRVNAGLLGGFQGRKYQLINAATGGLFKHWMAHQYLMAGTVGEGQPSVGWRVVDYNRL